MSSWSLTPNQACVTSACSILQPSWSHYSDNIFSKGSLVKLLHDVLWLLGQRSTSLIWSINHCLAWSLAAIQCQFSICIPHPPTLPSPMTPSSGCSHSSNFYLKITSSRKPVTEVKLSFGMCYQKDKFFSHSALPQLVFKYLLA